ncbi:MAG: corrinoid protein [Desulfomonilaceae bacterium]|nr:corrinoid protein [Desulfomonilaceae bacterium]
MDERELIENIAYNVIQGRVEAEDEGIDQGLEGQPGVTELVGQAIEQGVDTRRLVLEGLSEPMEKVGAKYESGEYLIPDMLAAAECVGAAMDLLGPKMLEAGVESKGKFVIATVHGDLHDIGKNIVAIMLKGAGYEVIDMGNNIPTARIVDKIKETNAPFLGLSALLTTTMRVMSEVIASLQENGLRDKVKVLIGGAPTSGKFAAEVGADAYCRDAFQAIDVLKEMARS